MIEQHRTMEVPGDGIVRDAGPNKQHEEFPRYMTHPAFRPGKPDKEIKVFNDAGQEVGKRYMGGESIRFAPVMARTAAQRDEHLAAGYQDNGKTDAAAFQRLVASAEPVRESYIPIEYPKFVFGKIVDNAEEAEARLIELNINADGSPREAAPASSEASVLDDLAGGPALDTEANTLEVWPAVPGAAAGSEAASEEDDIAALEAKLAALRAKKGPPVTHDEAVERVTDVLAEIASEQASASSTAAPVAATKAEKNAARVAKIKATMARKKAEKAAAALRDDVQAEAGEAE